MNTDASFVKAFIYEEFRDSYVVMGHYSKGALVHLIYP